MLRYQLVQPFYGIGHSAKFWNMGSKRLTQLFHFGAKLFYFDTIPRSCPSEDATGKKCRIASPVYQGLPCVPGMWMLRQIAREALNPLLGWQARIISDFARLSGQDLFLRSHRYAHLFRADHGTKNRIFFCLSRMQFVDLVSASENTS